MALASLRHWGNVPGNRIEAARTGPRVARFEPGAMCGQP
jgi:hypothetical protein